MARQNSINRAALALPFLLALALAEFLKTPPYDRGYPPVKP